MNKRSARPSEWEVRDPGAECLIASVEEQGSATARPGTLLRSAGRELGPARPVSTSRSTLGMEEPASRLASDRPGRDMMREITGRKIL